MDFSGKSVLVTAAAQGIGNAIALAFAKAGARVTATDINETVLREIDGRDGIVTAKLNVLDEAAVKALVEEVGQVDVLVCNAASNPYYGPQDGIADDQFRKILDNNIVSNHWLISMVAPEMRARRSGSIVIISSIGGLRGSPVIGAYCISKAADMQLARNLAVEYGPDNVRVNCIAPGLIKTDFARALWEDPEREKRTNSTTPLRRIGQPEEIAGGVVFLASSASAFMTGQTIVIDGGVTI